MGLKVLLLCLLGVACLAYGLGLVYAPLAPIVVGLALLGTAAALSLALSRRPS